MKPVYNKAIAMAITCALNKTISRQIAAYTVINNNKIFAYSVKQVCKWLKQGAEVQLVSAKITADPKGQRKQNTKKTVFANTNLQ